MVTDPRYPIGKFQPPAEFSAESRRACIAQIEELPAQLRAAVHGLSDEQLNQSYREGGWSLRQVVHHVADSHMNAFMRFKFALTEEEPAIKTYSEKLWAETEDSMKADVDTSLALIDALHRRWVVLLKSLSGEQLSRIYIHPVSGKASLDRALALYAWHGRHHTAHITTLRSEKGW